MFKVGWFSTGRDKAAIKLLKTVCKAIDTGEVKAKISFCFSNRAPGETEASDHFFDELKRRDIPLVYLSSAGFKVEERKEDIERWRADYDMKVKELICGLEVDLIVLAGYMLIVSPNLCGTYNMINLHPALPGGPTGTWQEVIKELRRVKADETGAMMHLVTSELDRGQPISYFRFPIRGTSFDLIRGKGVQREMPLILLTIKEFAEGNLRIEDGKVFAGGEALKHGYDLTEKIELWLSYHASGIKHRGE